MRIYVENKLPEPTSHALARRPLPNGMDGVAGLTQPHIEPGETFKYEFTVRQHGTHMYHPHFDEMVQQSMGMMGFLIFHPRSAAAPHRSRLRHLPERVVHQARAPPRPTPR